jgi:SAM-dependent methyltransferase
LQAYVGTTKHLGGFETTQALIELCHIDRETYVLDVGCGVGATACYLAQTYGCRVMGVDLREAMVVQANERAVREGVADLVAFRVADAQHMPFEDGTFDIVICESVATFIEDKQQVVREYARVARVGGTVGLNEEIWLQAPYDDLITYVRHTWDIQSAVPTAEDWLAMFERAGLRDMTSKVYAFDTRREATQVKRYRARDMVKMFWRTLVLYVTDPTFRAYMGDRKRMRMPKDLFAYFGYILLIGNK